MKRSELLRFIDATPDVPITDVRLLVGLIQSGDGELHMLWQAYREKSIGQDKLNRHVLRRLEQYRLNEVLQARRRR